VTEKGYKYFEISAATTKGVDDLLKEIRHQMSILPPVKVYESTYIEPIETDPDDRSVEITRDNNVFYVEGEWLLNVIGSVNFEDYESLQYFQRVLRKSGVIDKLTEKGIKEGDIVSIYDVEFEFVL
ncbi:MAG: Obg family GTPase CgtA, partial [Clostridia bacterium]|nr:Obg family GTPase CgtA [Clostridia bacterium]